MSAVTIHSDFGDQEDKVCLCDQIPNKGLNNWIHPSGVHSMDLRVVALYVWKCSYSSPLWCGGNYWTEPPRMDEMQLDIRAHAQLLSHDWLFVTPSTVACQLFCPGTDTGVGCHSLLQGSSWPRDWICISSTSCLGKQILYLWATRSAPL